MRIRMLKAWFSPNGRFSVGEWNADKFSPTPHIRNRDALSERTWKKDGVWSIIDRSLVCIDKKHRTEMQETDLLADVGATNSFTKEKR